MGEYNYKAINAFSKAMLLKNMVTSINELYVEFAESRSAEFVSLTPQNTDVIMSRVTLSTEFIQKPTSVGYYIII